jgi:hypothetical protein
MALMLREFYEALIEAGASKEKAQKVAEAMGSYEDRLGRVERRLDVHTCIMGATIVLALCVLWRLLE